MDAVLGTAGHIDHGKTSLIRALTGINCDRLDEEKRRGITIELGFAWLDLPDGRRLGIVDVPGHERFVKNMVAGAAGIDCMALVIAADEGVMPQTREHLDICTLLGVRSGIVVLTKKDMVDADWLEMVHEDVAQNLKGTFLENAPILDCSSATGEGLSEVREAIYRLVCSLPHSTGTDVLRLPVDRVFTLKGFGTVVTGTLVSGECNQGEELALMPSGKPMRARSLQVHGTQVSQAHRGQRCAMNLQGVDVGDIERGDIVARPGSLFPSRRWIALITCLPSSPLPIRQRMEVHFHHGAKECAARILFRDRDDLLQGETAIAEIHFAAPLAAIYGDHCVLRAHSPLRTIAGGIIIDPLPPLLRKRDPLFQQKFAALSRLGEISARGGSPEDLVRLALSLRPLPGASEKQLAVLTGLPSKSLRVAIDDLAAKGEILCWDSDGKNWIGQPEFESVLNKCRERAEKLHRREPLKSFFAHNAFCGGWGENLPARFTQKVIEAAIAGGILETEANGLKLASHEVALDSSQAALADRILAIYEQGACSPPLLRELGEQMAKDVRELLPLVSLLCDRGRLVKIQEGLYYSRAILDGILARINEWFATHENLDVGAMKTILDISRKYAIPLLEYMDAIKLTWRVGNQRQKK